MSESFEHTVPKPRRGFKIPQPVAVGFTVLLVIIAAWLVYDNVFRTTAAPDLSKYESIETRQPPMNRRMRNANANANPNPNAPPAPPATPAADSREGIYRTGNGFDVLVPGARARYVRAGQSLRLELNYVGPQLYAPRERNVAMARYFALNEKPLADAAKVTPEQIEKLKPIEFPRGMMTNDETYKSLVDLGLKYDKASDVDKREIEKQLVALVRSTAEASVAATSSAYTKNAEEVRKILSEEQIGALRTRRG